MRWLTRDLYTIILIMEQDRPLAITKRSSRKQNRPANDEMVEKPDRKAATRFQNLIVDQSDEILTEKDVFSLVALMATPSMPVVVRQHPDPYQMPVHEMRGGSQKAETLIIPTAEGACDPILTMFSKKNRYHAYGVYYSKANSSREYGQIPTDLGKSRMIFFGFLAPLYGWWIEVAIRVDPTSTSPQTLFLGNADSARRQEQNIDISFQITRAEHCVCINFCKEDRCVGQVHHLFVYLVDPQGVRREMLKTKLIIHGHKHETTKKQIAKKYVYSRHQCINLINGERCERDFSVNARQACG